MIPHLVHESSPPQHCRTRAQIHDGSDDFRPAASALSATETVRQPGQFFSAVLTLLILMLHTLTSSAASSATTLDGGGQHATSASYSMDGSLGGIAGFSSTGATTNRQGYIGQLTEVASLSVTGTPAFLNEGATSQLAGLATLDDMTVTMLSGSDIIWSAVSYPFASVDSNGVLTATNVYATVAGPVSGFYSGRLTNTYVQVIDNQPDNFGSYAGDQLPDSWQFAFFGLENPNAGPGMDVTGTGQNNRFKYVAGLDPTNAASVFVLKIASVAGQPNQTKLTFSPWASGRAYAVEYRTNLVTGGFTNLTTVSSPITNSTEVSVTDLSATEKNKFYRLQITYP
ncbi:MAG: hypothetical protein PCFJNLEI_00713 [Verrucomicrobiae bacterium]|nr:hypothetical protein [Verrucomicrobiae bacterium]